jgi:hypothetical protein
MSKDIGSYRFLDPSVVGDCAVEVVVLEVEEEKRELSEENEC